VCYGLQKRPTQADSGDRQRRVVQRQTTRLAMGIEVEVVCDEVRASLVLRRASGLWKERPRLAGHETERLLRAGAVREILKIQFLHGQCWRYGWQYRAGNGNGGEG
jgi:hypothetical protein